MKDQNVNDVTNLVLVRYQLNALKEVLNEVQKEKYNEVFSKLMDDFFKKDFYLGLSPEKQLEISQTFRTALV